MPRRLAALLLALLPSLWLLVAQPSAWATSVSIRTAATTATTSLTRSADLRLDLSATHVAAYWRGAPEARVTLAFSADGHTFAAPVDAGRDEVGEQRRNGITYGAVHVAPGTRVVRVASDRPLARLWVDGMTDGQRVVTRTRMHTAAAAAVPQPAVGSRAAWGADESLRYKADGTLKEQPTFHASRKLVVHHTATTNDDPDPAATLRSIYRYHVVTQGWADIGYNFFVDESGRSWEGRWSRAYEPGSSPTGDDAQGRGVTGSHTAGWNSGTVGIALLGSLGAREATPAARSALVDLLAWEAEKNGLDPAAATPFTNPVSGATVTTPNIAGHRDYGNTECPGGAFYATLPRLREEVAARIAGTAATPPSSTDISPPSVPTGVQAVAGTRSIALSWTASTDDRGVIGYLVLRSTTGKPGSFTQVGSPGGTTFADSGLKSGRRYWYAVQARDAAGNRSAPSQSVYATAR